MGSRWRAALASIVTSTASPGCLSKPDFVAPVIDAPPVDPALTTTTSGATCLPGAPPVDIPTGCVLTVTAGTVSHTFSPTNYRWPSDLRATGIQANWLAIGGVGQSDEDLIGLALIQTTMGLNVNPRANPMDRAWLSTLTLDEAGPARVVVTSAARATQSPSECAQPTNAKSTFSFYPDGRVTRRDSLTTLGGALACGYMTSYVSLGLAMFPELDWIAENGATSGSLMATSLPIVPGQTFGAGQYRLCARGSSGHVAMASAGAGGLQSSPFAGPRLSSYGSPSKLALVHDWVRDQAPTPSMNLESTITLHAGTEDNCAPLDLRLVRSPGLVSSGDYQFVAGVYDQLEAGAAFRDSESLPRGSAFRVAAAVVAVRVNGTALAADAFVSQPVTNGSLVWLRDEVASEAMIEF